MNKNSEMAMVLATAAAFGALAAPPSDYGRQRAERPEDVKREKLDKAAQKRARRARRNARIAGAAHEPA